MFSFYAGRAGGSFEASYRVYPVSFIDKLDAENGDKIFLPPSALDRLASLHIEYPMLFKIQNRKTGRETHCGVLEFIADEGMLYMPYWMMQNVVVEEGDIIAIRSATLPKGTFVKLQPHTQDFLDISNPKAVLETTLRGYSCLTKGDTICLQYNNKRYFIDIVEAKPQDAISVIETDCEVDFAPPLDYKEPERQPASISTVEDEEPQASEAAEPEEPKFQAFLGTGRRLDGKPSTSAPQPPPRLPGSSPATAGPRKATSENTIANVDGASGSKAGGSAATATAKRKVAGKIVFGSGNRLLEKKAAEQAGGGGPVPAPGNEEEQSNSNKSSFKAFSGKARSLKG